jgi:transposase
MEVLPMTKTYVQVVQEFHESVRDTIVSHPDLSYARIAKQFGVSEVTVYTIAAEFGVGRIKTGPKPGSLKMTQKEAT